MIQPTTVPLPPTRSRTANARRKMPAIIQGWRGFSAAAGLVLALASPTPTLAQQAPADKAAPKLSKSYFERVDALRERVDDGKLAEIRSTAIPITERKTFDVPEGKSEQTWWQYDDDTAFIYIDNAASQDIAGLELAFWIDSCSEKKQPPKIVHVVLTKPLRKNAQAVVKIPPNKLLHTKNDVSCLVVRGAWGK